MASQAELQLLISATNAAQQAVAAVQQGLQGIGNAAQQTQTHTGGLNTSIVNLNQSLGVLQKTFQGVRAAVQGTLEDFIKYDQAMNAVERVTQSSHGEMAEFTRGVDDLVKRLQGVPQSQILHIADEAAQIGIRGTPNLLAFTEQMVKFQAVTKGLGQDAPKQVAQILNAFGEGLDHGSAGLDKFINVFTRLRQSAAVDVQNFLTFSGRLSEAGSLFKIPSEDVQAIASVAASIKGLQPERFGTSITQVFTQLNTATIQGNAAMQGLLQNLGTTREEFARLIKTNPAEALLRFVQVAQRVKDSGKDLKEFLRTFKLDAVETVSVIGDLANDKTLPKLFQALATARKEAKDMTVVEQEWASVQKQLSFNIQEGSTAITQMQTSLGAALAPGVRVIVKLFADALQATRAWFESLPEGGQQVVAWAAVTTVSLTAIAAAIAALGAIFGSAGVVGLVTSGFALMAGAATAFLGILFSVPALIIAATAALVGLGVAIYKNWDDIKAYFETHTLADFIIDGLKALPSTMAAWWAAFIDFTKRQWQNVKNIFTGEPGGVLGRNGELKVPGSGGAPKFETPPPILGNNKTNAEGTSALGEATRKLLEELDTYSKTLEKIHAQELALQALRRLPTNDKYFQDLKIAPQYINEYIARLERRIALEKIAAEPILAQTKALQDQLDIARIAGNYQEADRQAQVTINALRDKGVDIYTQGLIPAVREYQRAVQDLNKSQTSGFEGFAKQVGSIRDQMLDFQKQFASQVSQSLADMFTGAENNLRTFAINIGKTLVKAFTDRAVADAVSSLGNNVGGLFKGLSSNDAANKAQTALDNFTKNGIVNTMTVNAAAVTLNGATLPGAAGQISLGGPNGPTPFNTPVAPLGQVTSSPLPAATAAIQQPIPVVLTQPGGIPLPQPNPLTAGNVPPNSQGSIFGGLGFTPLGFNRDASNAPADTTGIDQAKQSLDSLNESASNAASANDRVKQGYDSLGASGDGAASANDRVNQGFNSLSTGGQNAASAMESANVSLTTAGTSATVAGTGFDMAGASTTNAGTAASTAAPQIDQAAVSLQNAGAAASAASTSSFGLGSIFTSLGTSLFTTTVSRAASKMHGGGLAGRDGTPIIVPEHLFKDAPRYHDGLKDNELAAVLEKGERVLTAGDTKKVKAAASDGSSVSNAINFNPVYNFDMKGNQQQGGSQPSAQVTDQFSKALDNRVRSTVAEFIINESRPGGMLGARK